MSKLDIELGDSLSGVTKESKEIVQAGMEMGWTARWGNHRKSLIVLRSPDRMNRINVPTDGLNYNRARSLVRRLVRHTTEAEIEGYMASAGEDKVKARIADTAFGTMIEFQREDEAPEEQAPEEQVVEERYLNAKGEEIPGDWWVRTHPDGAVEYVCKAHREEFVVQRKAQVAGHGKAHSPKVLRRDEETRNYYVEPVPAESEVETRVYTEPEAAPQEVASATPKGDLVGRIEEMIHEYTRDLRAEISVLTRELAAARADADKARGNLRAFRDLLQEVD